MKEVSMVKLMNLLETAIVEFRERRIIIEELDDCLFMLDKMAFAIVEDGEHGDFAKHLKDLANRRMEG